MYRYCIAYDIYQYPPSPNTSYGCKDQLDESLNEDKIETNTNGDCWT